MPKVSICIPTYNRPELLKVAVDSCLAQTFQDFEIVIVDDSADTVSEALIARIVPKQRLNYVRNPRKTGQASSVNQSFGLAQGEFLVPLHDDNFLMPNALEDLIKPMERQPSIIASFGKTYLAKNDGSILVPESERLNELFFKSEANANSIQRSEWSAIVLQFPADGCLIRTEAARKTLYRDDPEVGEACDAEFGYRLAELGDFFFVGKYTYAYRVTEESISSKGLRIHLSKQYFLLQKRVVSGDLEDVRRAMLRSLAPVAVTGCLLTAERGKAVRVLLGRNYPWKKEFAKGVIQFALAFAPRATAEMIVKQRSRGQRSAPGAWAYSAQRVGEDRHLG